MGTLVDNEPYEIKVYDRNRRTKEVIEYTVFIREFGERDVARRSKFIQQPDSSENSRRGRSRRGQQQIHAERLRLFSFLHGIVDWDLKFPEDYWDEDQGRRVPHPKANQKMPRTREIFDMVPERLMDQIIDEINDLNEPLEPPENRIHVKDADGNEKYDPDTGEPVMRDMTEEEKEEQLPPSEENSGDRRDTGSTTHRETTSG